jgi:hypothetical protein
MGVTVWRTRLAQLLKPQTSSMSIRAVGLTDTNWKFCLGHFELLLFRKGKLRYSNTTHAITALPPFMPTEIRIS